MLGYLRQKCGNKTKFLVKSTYTISTTKVRIKSTVKKLIDSVGIILQMTWMNARLECNKQGMDLVMAETPEENECIKSFIMKQGCHETLFYNKQAT
jgi:regulation of enolase protein 1 (concanavalin A-like superfamily)